MSSAQLLWEELWAEYSVKAKDYWARVEVVESAPASPAFLASPRPPPAPREISIPPKCHLDQTPLDFPTAFTRALAASYNGKDLESLGFGACKLKAGLIDKRETIKELQSAFATLQPTETPVANFLGTFSVKIKQARKQDREAAKHQLWAALCERSVPIEIDTGAYRAAQSNRVVDEMGMLEKYYEGLAAKVGEPKNPQERISIAKTTQRISYLVETFGSDDMMLASELRRAKAITKMAAMTSSTKKVPLSTEESKLIKEHDKLNRLNLDSLYQDVTSSLENLELDNSPLDVELVKLQAQARASVVQSAARISRTAEILASDKRIIDQLLEHLEGQTKTVQQMISNRS